MSFMAFVIFDVGLLAVNLSHVPSSIAIACGARLLELEVDEPPTQKHGRQRMLALQGRRCRIEQLIKIAVDLFDAGVDDTNCTVEGRLVDQERKCSMDVSMMLHLRERSILGLDVLEIAQLLQVRLENWLAPATQSVAA